MFLIKICKTCQFYIKIFVTVYSNIFSFLYCSSVYAVPHLHILFRHELARILFRQNQYLFVLFLYFSTLYVLLLCSSLPKTVIGLCYFKYRFQYCAGFNCFISDIVFNIALDLIVLYQI